MNRLVSHVSKNVLFILSFFAISTGKASAQLYYSQAPEPPSAPEAKSTQYIISTTDGTDFYSVNPYYSLQTTDGNLYISSIIVQQDRRQSLGTYIQIDCGRKIYRDLVPWYEIDRYGYGRFKNPTTYNWTYFKQDSAFEKVGKLLCTSAESDRGLSSYDSAWK
jgi:hypothetical protein